MGGKRRCRGERTSLWGCNCLFNFSFCPIRFAKWSLEDGSASPLDSPLDSAAPSSSFCSPPSLSTHTHTHTRKPIQSAVPVDVDEFCFNSASWLQFLIKIVYMHVIQCSLPKRNLFILYFNNLRKEDLSL